jgi:UDP-glucose 4-epimerase
MANILVTGGAGYIGSHTCLALAKKGYTPVVFDNLVNGHREFVRWGPFEQGDIRDRARLEQVIDRHKPADLFAAALRAEINKVVFSSTCGSPNPIRHPPRNSDERKPSAIADQPLRHQQIAGGANPERPR